MRPEEIKKIVQSGYAKIAGAGESCCSGSGAYSDATRCNDAAGRLGYTDDDLKAVPAGANLGLGCGNPIAIAALKAGETVLDLGSGAGFDCFLAAAAVGDTGRVIGVDMTPEMINKAKENALKGNFENVEFRLGEIENLPVPDNCVDIVISNCVINLSPEKERVFREAFRVLRPGGRLMVSDIVLLREIPETVKNSIEGYIGCLSGAVLRERYLDRIVEAGFTDVTVVAEDVYTPKLLRGDPVAEAIAGKLDLPPDELAGMVGSFASVKVFARKPGLPAEE